MTEDDILHVTLQKRDKGQTWSSPILGQGQLDPYASDLEQKRLMLQRFQEEVIWLSSTEIYVSYVAFSYHLGIPAVASVEVFTRFLLPSCSFMLIHWRVNCYLLFLLFFCWLTHCALLGGLAIVMNYLTLSTHWCLICGLLF